MTGIPGTKPEIILNQWVFIQRYTHPAGIFPLIYQLGLRLYLATGSDNDKLALLGSLAAWDYHLASIFPVPKSRTVHLGLGPADEVRVPTLTGVVPDQLIKGPEAQMELFGEALETVRRLLPEDPLTMEFKHTPLEDLSLLYTFTPVIVGEDGGMTALTRVPELGTVDPHVALNLWALPDPGSHLVQTLAGRAYLVTGDRKTVEAVLANLSAADHLLASRIALPASFPTTGDVSHPMDFTGVMAHEDAMFSLVEDQIRKEIPVKYGDVERKSTSRYTLPSGPRIRRTSLVGVHSAGSTATG